MKRRRFLGAGLCAVTTLVPLPAAPAPRPSTPARIGWLSFGSITSHGPYVEAFRQGMRELGYIEGKSYVVDFQWVEDPKLLTEKATTLIRERPDVIVATCTFTSGTALKISPEVPIVLAISGDPVNLGWAQSLAHPGGNVTGVVTLSPEITAKRLELLKEVLPTARRVAVLNDPDDQTRPRALAEAQRAAQLLGLELVIFDTRNDSDYAQALADARGANADAALMLWSASTFYLDRRKLAALALDHRLPSSFPYYEFVEDGGLMSYGPDVRGLFRHSATYVDRILKGTKPGDLPIEQPTRLELAINEKTAQALGVAIPRSVLLRADRMIE